MKLNASLITLFISLTIAAIPSQLVGTWTTKSAATFTGASFYNPVDDVFIEPSHTGISYSFTADGFYEEALYRAISNPTKPSCPKAILQFQHGKFSENPDGSLTLTPFSVDGRQLLSDPCKSKYSAYTRYNQSETMEKYQVYIDPYTKMPRLDLYLFNGAKLPPMYLAYSPPQMLPTITLNPTATVASSGKRAKRTLDQAMSWEDLELPLNKHATHLKRKEQVSLISIINADIIWWGGVGITLLGGAFFFL